MVQRTISISDVKADSPSNGAVDITVSYFHRRFQVVSVCQTTCDCRRHCAAGAMGVGGMDSFGCEPDLFVSDFQYVDADVGIRVATFA